MSRNIRKVIICVSNGKLHRPERKWCWGLSCVYIITTFVTTSLCDEFTYHVLYYIISELVTQNWRTHLYSASSRWSCTYRYLGLYASTLLITGNFHVSKLSPRLRIGLLRYEMKRWTRHMWRVHWLPSYTWRNYTVEAYSSTSRLSPTYHKHYIVKFVNAKAISTYTLAVDSCKVIVCNC